MLLPDLASDPLPLEAAEWRKVFGGLRPTSPPCRYVNPTAWANIHEACTDFIERYGAEAVRLGWTATELFSVHPTAGAVRADYCGALMLAGEPITAVTAQHMKWKCASRVHEMPGQPNGGVPVWLFGK